MIAVVPILSFAQGLLSGGHSDLYNQTVAAIPGYKTRALAGDTGAYAILHCLAGDQAYHDAAIAAGQIGTVKGETSTCGAADAYTKGLAKAAILEVDARQKFALIAGQVTLLAAQAGTIADSGTYTSTVGQGLLQKFGIGAPATSTIVVGVAVVGVILFLVLRRH